MKTFFASLATLSLVACGNMDDLNAQNTGDVSTDESALTDAQCRSEISRALAAGDTATARKLDATCQRQLSDAAEQARLIKECRMLINRALAAGDTAEARQIDKRCHAALGDADVKTDGPNSPTTKSP